MIHKCPVCNTKYDKVDGCNLITCPKCGKYSCYLCNQNIIPINGSKYYHFTGYNATTIASTCGLYATDYSRIDKLNAYLREMLKKYVDEIQIHNAICDELSKRNFYFKKILSKKIK